MYYLCTTFNTRKMKELAVLALTTDNVVVGYWNSEAGKFVAGGNAQFYNKAEASKALKEAEDYCLANECNFSCSIV
jgi:hypothetical protein